MLLQYSCFLYPLLFVSDLTLLAAKNIVLMGTKSVTIHDQETVKIADLSSHVRLLPGFV